MDPQSGAIDLTDRNAGTEFVEVFGDSVEAIETPPVGVVVPEHESVRCEQRQEDFRVRLHFVIAVSGIEENEVEAAGGVGGEGFRHHLGDATLDPGRQGRVAVGLAVIGKAVDGDKSRVAGHVAGEHQGGVAAEAADLEQTARPRASRDLREHEHIDHRRRPRTGRQFVKDHRGRIKAVEIGRRGKNREFQAVLVDGRKGLIDAGARFEEAGDHVEWVLGEVIAMDGSRRGSRECHLRRSQRKRATP